MPKSKSVALVVVLVAIVVLFVVGVGAGLRRTDTPGSGAGSEKDRKEARSRWLKPRSVRAAELSGCTRALGPFRVVGTCALTVAPSDEMSRDLTLRSADDVEAHYEPKSGPPVPINVTLRDGKDVRFPVQEGGASISLLCAKERCVVEVIASSSD